MVKDRKRSPTLDSLRERARRLGISTGGNKQELKRRIARERHRLEDARKHRKPYRQQQRGQQQRGKKDIPIQDLRDKAKKYGLKDYGDREHLERRLKDRNARRRKDSGYRKGDKEENRVLLAYCGSQCFADKEHKIPICPKCDEKQCYCKPECGALRDAFIKGHNKNKMMSYARALDCGWPDMSPSRTSHPDRGLPKTEFYEGQYVVGYRSIDKLKYPYFGVVSSVRNDSLGIDELRYEDIGIIQLYEEFLSKEVYANPEDVLEIGSVFEVVPDFNNRKRTLKTSLKGFWQDHKVNFKSFDFDNTYTRYYDLKDIKKVFKKYELIDGGSAYVSSKSRSPKKRYERRGENVARRDPSRKREKYTEYRTGPRGSPKPSRITVEEFLTEIRNGNSTILRKYKKQGSDINRFGGKDSRYKDLNVTLLAFKYGHDNILRELLSGDYKVNWTARDEKKRTPLIIAVEKGKTKFVKDLLEKKDIKLNAYDSSGKTALDIAIEKDDVSLMRKLLDAGAKFKYAKDTSRTANHCISDECRELLNQYEVKIREQMRLLQTSKIQDTLTQGLTNRPSVTNKNIDTNMTYQRY
jgi:hypothetical protein